MFSPFSKTPNSLKGVRHIKPVFTPSPKSIGNTPKHKSCSFMSRGFNESVMQGIPSYEMEFYGSQLPVLVTEAMTLAERPADISVKLEPFGFASLVCGRQLLIWKYKIDNQEKNVVYCRELTLPPSDLAHKAELVHLFQTEDSKLPSALAVSPEGHVRYWPNINHESCSVDTVIDLQGEECYSLVSVFPLGCILSTTTSTLVLITSSSGEGQPNLICRPLTLPLSVLAGIGRRVSSFIFGVVPTQTSEAKQLNRVLSVKGDDDDYFLYVLSSNVLQKWHISKKDKKDNLDQLVFEMELDCALKQSYGEDVFKKDSSSLGGMKTWCLDMQISSSGVMILTAGTFSGTDLNIHYALGKLETSSDQIPAKFSAFHVLDYREQYEEEHEDRHMNFKFILPSPTSQCAFIFNSEKVLCAQLGSNAETAEMNVRTTGSFILGSGTCDGLPLFFITEYGIVSFASSQKAVGDSRFLSSMKEVSPQQNDELESHESLSKDLKKALYCFCDGSIENCEKIMNELQARASYKEGADLDEAVTTLSLGIIDDYPMRDPRWCKTVPGGSISSSLIITYQLDDKLTAHDYLYSFLKTYKILEKLSVSKIDDAIISTRLLFCEHTEKLIAAKTMRLYLVDHFDAIESAIQLALTKRGIESNDDLTAQDVFFREVSAFHFIFPSFIEWESEILSEDESVPKILNVVMTVNKIFVGVFEAIINYRISAWERYTANTTDYDSPFLPWTSREGNAGIRSQIKEQLNININHVLRITDNVQIQGILYQQYVDILDFYLDSFKKQLETSKKEKMMPVQKEYEKERSHYIKYLLVLGQYERAAAIAEKYLDFDMLIQICEETQNSDRLQRYMLQFAEKKFSEHVFKWYLNKGQRGKIFNKDLGQKEVLGNFLKEHESLKWLHFVQERQYEAASATLKQLALKEVQFLNRRKTLLSLSKLTAMVSSISPEQKRNIIEAINFEQDLITHQETLPISTVEALGIDPKNMRVFQPAELIEMYIADENPSANAFDFKIALDLLHFMKKPLSDPDLNNLRIHIWSKAILKDNWEELDINNPLVAIKDTIFFQVVEIAFNQGIEMHEFIPSLDDLLQASELQNLVENSSVRFLLQAGYEHIFKIID
ncbi:nuclear pore complex protein Nup133-like [Uloborus diversus]|uniref:nuclear pore complex protein Nup133-like n=1 Tax=Uloborus diversus TaxID=327109 RepID=UPI0024094B7B|nr:nuclear pore complex protein Nup133-like [Uloborus diversus]